MVFKRLSVFFVLLAAAIAVMFSCGKDYNPFNDLTNAKARVLSWCFQGMDSVSIYTTGTIKTVVALSEDVDSFMVSAGKNRFFGDTVVRRHSGPASVNGGPFLFPVSFFDTGMQTVTVTTFRSNGEVIPDEFSIRAVSPLYYGDVQKDYGVPFLASTPGVTDKDVQYHWYFGPGREVSALAETLTVTFTNGQQVLGKGAVWVTDLSGMHASPADSFSWSFKDTSKPIIYYFDDMKNDTIFTGDSIFVFRVHIIDNTDQIVDTCSVNGASFDFNNPKTAVYTKIFKDLTRYFRQDGPLAITVWAMDNQQFHNAATRTFYALYDSSGVKNADARVSFSIPENDSVTYRNAEITVTGTAENYRTQTMIVRIAINDSVSSGYATIQGRSGVWVWQVRLRAGRNQVVAAAYSTDNGFLAADTVNVLFDPNFIDTIKPMIWSITTNSGSPAADFTTSGAAETLKIVAFDEGSGIKSVLVNGVAAQSVDSNNYLWTASTGPLTHQIKGNDITIRAIDQVNNFCEQTMVMYKNSLPRLVSATMPRSLCVDTAYSLRLACFDADNDPVTFQWVHAPKGMTVAAEGGFSWKPAATAIGADSMVVHLLDGYGQTPDTTFYFSINDCGQAHAPVHFTTTKRDFPSLMQAGVDSMSVVLAIDKQPSEYTPQYSARFTDRDQSIERNVASPLLTWRPVEADTGARGLMVTVGDGAICFDTLYPAIRVVRRNQYPCSLSWTSTTALTTAGALDLTAATQADTLNFTIRDQDDPLTEKYSVSITRNNLRTIQETNDRTFLIALSPGSSKVSDTLRVSISDQTKTADSMALVIMYKPGAYSVRLQLNTTASGAGVLTDQFGFPVLVRLTASNFDFNKAQGQNVNFTKTDGTDLSYEIEQWDSLAQSAVIWVKADTVYGNDSTHAIMLNCGNTGISNPHAVFDTANGFCGVWHLNEYPAGAGSITDRTVLGNNGTPYGAMNAANQVPGLIGKGLNFNGTSNYISFGDINATDGTTKLTASAWINPSILNDWGPIIGKADVQENQWGFTESSNTGTAVYGKDDFLVTARNGGTISSMDGSTNGNILSTGSWFYCVMVYDGAQLTNDTRLKFYFNGVQQTLIFRGTVPAFLPSTTAAVQIAKTPISTGYFEGIIDEAIVARDARSADWLRLSYMNQKPQDALVMFR